MPVYLIERSFAEELEAVKDLAPGINQVNEDVGVQWLISFLSADKKKTYCLYEAPSVQAIQEAAQRAGLPVDVIISVTEIQSNGRWAMSNRSGLAWSNKRMPDGARFAYAARLDF